MNRDEAKIIVNNFTFKIGQYLAVNFSDCLRILGPEKFLLLRSDPIRRLGPIKETVYPWNLIDYLVCDNLKQKTIKSGIKMNQKARWAEIHKTQLDAIKYDERFNSIKNKRSNRPDLHAFLLLDSLFPGPNDMIAGATHDEIFLDISENQIAVLTDEQILELMKCGVRYGEDCLCMFA